MIELPSNIVRIKVPLKGNPLGFVNSYLVVSEEGCILIDSGWNTEDSFMALEKGVREAGKALADVAYLVATHAHPDHFGLMGRLQEHTDARVIIHESELRSIAAIDADRQQYVRASEDWLRRNGVPASLLARLSEAYLEMMSRAADIKRAEPVRGA